MDERSVLQFDLPTAEQLVKWADKVQTGKHKPLTFEEVQHKLSKHELDLIQRYKPAHRVDVSALQRRCQQSIDDLIGRDRDFLYIDNGASVLAVAHVDTVFSPATPVFKREGDYVISGALDDRLGVYIILDYLPKLGLGQQYDILLTTDEEMCQSTAQLFKAPDGKVYNWIFEFDRSGSEPVMYQYQDKESEDLLAEHGMLVDQGSYSDIADLEDLGCKAFNFGVGYYAAHQSLCHAVLPLVGALVERFRQFFAAMRDTHLPHVKTKRNRYKSSKYDWYAGRYGSDYQAYGWGACDYSEDDYYAITDSMDNDQIAELAMRDGATAQTVIENIALEFGVDFVLSVLGITLADN
jgi:hypothetical protein